MRENDAKPLPKPKNYKQIEAGNSVRFWLTRSEVRAQLRISYSRLRIYEGWGWLHPRVAAEVGYRRPPTGHGRPPRVVYAADEVEQISQRRRLMRRASAAQRAFAAFREGRGQVDVVVELGIEPALARELYADYASAAGCVLLPGDVVTRLRELGFTVTAATFLTVVRNLLDAARGRMARRPRTVRFLADPTGEPR